MFNLYEVLVNYWPRVFAISTTDIKAGEELLTDYGEDYWDNFREMWKRRQQLIQIKNRIKNEYPKDVQPILLEKKNLYKNAWMTVMQMIQAKIPHAIPSMPQNLKEFAKELGVSIESLSTEPQSMTNGPQ